MGLQGLGKVVGLAPFSQRELVGRALGGTGQSVQRNRGVGLLFHGPLVHHPLEALDLLGLGLYGLRRKRRHLLDHGLHELVVGVLGLDLGREIRQTRGQ